MNDSLVRKSNPSICQSLISFSCTNKTKQMSVFPTHTVLKRFFLNVNIYIFFLSKRQEIHNRLDREPKTEKEKKSERKMTFCFNLLFAIQSENRINKRHTHTHMFDGFYLHKKKE